MFDLANNKSITLDEGHRELLREVLEKHRNEVTLKLYGNSETVFTTVYHDIELDTIDEILSLLGEE